MVTPAARERGMACQQEKEGSLEQRGRTTNTSTRSGRERLRRAGATVVRGGAFIKRRRGNGSGEAHGGGPVVSRVLDKDDVGALKEAEGQTMSTTRESFSRLTW